MMAKRRVAVAMAAVAGSGVVLASVLPAQAMGAARGVTTGASASAAAVSRAVPSDRTSALEAARVDRVKVRVQWKACVDTPTYDYLDQAQCATVPLPLDYDRPQGPTVDVAVLRVPARDPKRRIGILFGNPGGPGGSAVQWANENALALADEVQDRFDIVGFDPRGIGSSTNVRCFRNTEEQDPVAAQLQQFPISRTEIAARRAASGALARGCSTLAKPLIEHMSTAEVARDMDVLRRTLGDRQLTYLGYSYGTYLGQMYANLFPDRVRAVMIDGVIDPVGWAGTPATRNQTQDDRGKTAEGSAAGFNELLARCSKVGATLCPLAGRGDPAEQFELLARRLKEKPASIIVPGETEPFIVTYQLTIGAMSGGLYRRVGAEATLELVRLLLEATDDRGSATARATARQRAGRLYADTMAYVSSIGRPSAGSTGSSGLSGSTGSAQPRAGEEPPYDNSAETYAAVACTDGLHPYSFNRFVAAGLAADRRVPHFGRYWVYASAECAREYWTVRDRDAYFGPFTKRTSGPVLIVGSYYDPATPYLAAQAASRLLPNSRLLSVDGFGHTAYGFNNTCVNEKVNAFFLRRVLPAKGTVCVSDVQPFQTPPGSRTQRPDTAGSVIGRPLPGFGG